MSGAEADIRIRREGAVGRITLTRPKALNALTPAMCLAMEQALRDWAEDDAVTLAIVDAEGGKAFCAGGDVAEMCRRGRAGDTAFARAFFQDEYRLNRMIGDFPKPYVALMDGIVMGGGVGISAHGSHRIVTERTMMAMPECAIGMIPDVGGTHLLGAAPGRTGEYLGMTGARMDAADAIFAGFADVMVPADRLADLVAALTSRADPVVIADFTQAPGDSALAALQPAVEAVFSGESAVATRAALAAESADWATKALSQMDHGSPLSVVMTQTLVRAARAAPGLVEALMREFRFAAQASEHADFLEGVRAALIDKDRSPKWTHADLAAVPAELVAKLSAPDALGELDFTPPKG